MADPRLSFALVALALVSACASSPKAAEVAAVPPGSAAPVRTPDPDASSFEGAGLGRIVDGAAGLELAVPGRGAWTVEHDHGWLVATHAATGTRLSARSWRAEGLVNHEGCGAEARRRWSTFPRQSPGDVLSERPARAPRGYDTHVSISLVDAPDGSEIGVLLAVGANVRRCVALAVETRTAGAGAPRMALERLVTLERRILPSVVVLGVSDRVARPGY